MNKLRTLINFLTICLVLIVTSCSSTQEQTSEDDMDLGNGNVASESINSAEAEPLGEGNNFAEAEGVNNVVDNEFGDASEANSLNLGSNQSMQASPSNNLVLSNPNALAAPTNNAALVPSNTATTPTNLVPTNAAGMANAATATEAAPSITNPTVPTTAGVVKYVMTSAPISDQPGGVSVGSLEQGDHPLIWEEGQFARMPNGKYVPVNSLSEKGVGRIRNTTSWRRSGE